MATTITTDSKILSRVDYTQIEDELILFLRNKLIDRRARTSNKTETFTPDGSTTLFELTGDLDNKDRHKVMNIRSLSIDGIDKTYYTDYVCGFKLRNTTLTSNNEDLGKIRFWNPPVGSEISVNYDYSSSFVWAQNNRVDLSTIAYPRVVLDSSGAMEDLGIGGNATIHTIAVNILVTDTLIEGVRSMIQQIKNIFVNNEVKQGFHNFNYIQITSIGEGPVVNQQDSNDVIYEQTITLSIPNQIEVSGVC